MSVKLRLRRMGRKKLPIWGLVAADSRAPRDGRFIEDLGRYEPIQEPAVVKLNHERIVYWLLEGAQPSDTVRNLLKRDGVLMRAAMTRKGASAEDIEQAMAELMERQAVRDEKKNAKPTTAQRRQKALESERESAKERAAELAKARAEKEAELERLRKDTEEKARAEKEAQLVAASAEAGDAAADAAPDAADEAAPEGATTGAEADAAADADGTTVEAVQGDMSDASTGNAAPITDAPAEEAAAEKVADLKAGDASGADAVQAEAKEAVVEAKKEVKEEAADAAPTEEKAAKAEAKAEEAPAADAAAETQAADVSEEAPAAAEEQPAVEDDSTEAVADDAGEAVAEQADAGAADEPEAEKAAPKKAKASSKGDKLTDLWGVGPKYAGILTDAGVTTFAEVASKSVEELQAIITDAGSSTAGNEETWAKQAELLAAGDSDAFDAYVEEMKNA